MKGSGDGRPRRARSPGLCWFASPAQDDSIIACAAVIALNRKKIDS